MSFGSILHESRSGTASCDCRNARDKRVVWVDILTTESPPMTTTAYLVAVGQKARKLGDNRGRDQVLYPMDSHSALALGVESSDVASGKTRL